MKSKLNKEYFEKLVNAHFRNVRSTIFGFTIGVFEESASGPDSGLENVVEGFAYTTGYFAVEKLSHKLLKGYNMKDDVSGPYFFGGFLAGQTLTNYLKKKIINS